MIFPALSNLQVNPVFISTASRGIHSLNGLVLRPTLYYGSHCYNKFAVIVTQTTVPWLSLKYCVHFKLNIKEKNWIPYWETSVSILHIYSAIWWLHFMCSSYVNYKLMEASNLKPDPAAKTMVEQFLRSNYRTIWRTNESIYMHTWCPEIFLQHLNTPVRQDNNTCQYPADSSLMGISMYKQESPKSSKMN